MPGGYIDFVNSMLKLRDQRLEEERYKQLERMENQKQMLSTIGDIGEGIASAGQQYGQNQMANQLMSETYGAPPRAQAVDPSMQGPADLAAERMPGFYTGGMPELTMRMKMDEFKSKDLARQADIYSKTQNLKFAKSKWLVDQASTAAKEQSKEQTGAFKDTLAYIKQRDAVMDALSSAENPEQYKSSMDTLNALEATAEKRGLKVPPVDRNTIAPFMTETEKTSLTTQQTAVGQARTALEEAKKTEPGWLDTILPMAQGALGMDVGGPTYKDKAVQTAQELYEQQQKKLREMPGASFYGEKPVTKPQGELKETGGTGGGEAPEGTRVTKGNVTLIKKNGEWVVEQ